MAKNTCAKTRPKDRPYEVWTTGPIEQGGWTWNVLKKWQADDSKPYARWFCNVVTPICPDGEMGDVYVSEIKSVARCIKRDLDATATAPALKMVDQTDALLRNLRNAGF